MGQAAGELSDLVILTSDNPRSEDPLQVMNDALVGLRRTDTRTIVEPDRGLAIRKAIEEAQSAFFTSFPDAATSLEATVIDPPHVAMFVTMNATQRAAPGDYQGIVRVKSGGTEIAHAVVYAFVKQGQK